MLEGAAGGLPVVTAIMAFGDRRRIAMARGAVAMFRQQTYRPVQLVIANASGVPVLDRPVPWIRELAVEGGRVSVGALRNAALDVAAGDWCLHWDDDDIHDDGYIAARVAMRREGQASLLTNQVRFNFIESSACMCFRPDGIPATIFYPRTAARFAQADRGETEAFWIDHWVYRTDVVSNHRFAANCLSVAVYHGLNLTPAEEFMLGNHGPAHRGQWHLQAAEADRVRALLASRGIGTTVGIRPSEGGSEVPEASESPGSAENL
jgi:hypothetical protein